MPLTYILAEDVARCAVTALTAPGVEGELIDLGTEKPMTPRELSAELSHALGHQIEPKLFSFSSGDADFDAFIAYMNTGQYVADTSKQTQFFSPVPSLTNSVQRWIASTNLNGGKNGNN